MANPNVKESVRLYLNGTPSLASALTLEVSSQSTAYQR